MSARLLANGAHWDFIGYKSTGIQGSVLIAHDTFTGYGAPEDFWGLSTSPWLFVSLNRELSRSQSLLSSFVEADSQCLLVLPVTK